MWSRAAATALIEDDNAVAGWIEELAGLRGSATSGPPVHEYTRFTLRIARLFEIHLVAVPDVKPGMSIGFICGVEGSHSSIPEDVWLNATIYSQDYILLPSVNLKKTVFQRVNVAKWEGETHSDDLNYNGDENDRDRG